MSGAAASCAGEGAAAPKKIAKPATVIRLERVIRQSLQSRTDGLPAQTAERHCRTTRAAIADEAATKTIGADVMGITQRTWKWWVVASERSCEVIRIPVFQEGRAG